ncbi:MAG: hypothetical protein U9Q38_08405, partial [Thermodesulfobacteriota bacterium]|nr:hypothetical protein [Thermodesulfobacteriota bacterium]
RLNWWLFCLAVINRCMNKNNIEALKKLKHAQSITKAWKKRKDYLGSTKYSYLYNCWRGIRFTNKGKKIGCDDRWEKFKDFYNDMIDSYVSNTKLGRIDKTKPYSLKNCAWMSNEEIVALRPNTPTLEYNSEIKTLKEWSMLYELPYNGIRQRYYKGKNYTAKEIIFGKDIYKKRKLIDQSNLDMQQKRNKASKMIAQYRLHDRKRGMNCDLTIDWFVENILTKTCHYCGSEKNIGADRIKNDIGHTINNIVPCCYVCNIIKNNIFTSDEMYVLGKVAKNIIDKRGIY